MYNTINDFISEWKYESESTLKVFSNINDTSLNKKDHEDVRTIAILAWHITLTIPEMMSKTGLMVEGPDEHSKPPASIGEIISAYRTASDSLVQQIDSKWTDASLKVEVNMYGEQWKNGATVSTLVKHHAHHRGQLTILMRLAGLKVPGIYGPSKEEWAQMNMPAME